MNENKQALQVAALKNGTVIDHIPSEKLFTVVQLLGVEQMKCNITIGFNLDSKKARKKRHHQNCRQILLRRRNQPYIGSSTLRRSEHHPRLRGCREERSQNAGRTVRHRKNAPIRNVSRTTSLCLRYFM